MSILQKKVPTLVKRRMKRTTYMAAYLVMNIVLICSIVYYGEALSNNPCDVCEDNGYECYYKSGGGSSPVFTQGLNISSEDIDEIFRMEDLNNE